ncbi:unnamed protein product, partial [Somion occarium]
EVVQQHSPQPDVAALPVPADLPLPAPHEVQPAPKKGPAFPPLLEDHAAPDFLYHRVSAFAADRLVKAQYTELYYFTPEGCRVASEQFKTTNSDAFGLLQGPDGLASLQPQSTTRALKHVIRDADLTWEQFSLAVPTYLREIERADWPKTHVEMISEALLRYQAKTRYDWHELISRGSPSYSLALINNNLLDQMCSEIADEIFLAQQKQLFPSKPILCIPHATFPPLHLTCTFTASHTHPHRVSHAFSLPPPPPASRRCLPTRR